MAAKACIENEQIVTNSTPFHESSSIWVHFGPWWLRAMTFYGVKNTGASSTLKIRNRKQIIGMRNTHCVCKVYIVYVIGGGANWAQSFPI